jgi:hypothetical protein
MELLNQEYAVVTGVGAEVGMMLVSVPVIVYSVIKLKLKFLPLIIRRKNWTKIQKDSLRGFIGLKVPLAVASIDDTQLLPPSVG